MKNKVIIEILVNKAIDDLKKLKTEARNRNLESQIGRWFSSYMAGLQKTCPEAHSIMIEKIENGEM